MRLSNLTEPLLKGKPVCLTVLDFGTFRVLSGPRDVGLMGFLIETDAGEYVMVDTGLPAKYATDPVSAGMKDNLNAFGHVIDINGYNTANGQLAACDLTPDDIDMLIITHTHIDHMGGIDCAPTAPIVMAKAERDLDRPLYWGEVSPIPWPDREYLLVDQDVPVGPELDLLFVPGHAPGQLALFLTLPKTGPVLLTSDAISRPSEVDEGFEGSWDVPLAVHHGNRLLDLAQDRDAFIIYGHCPEQWKQLRRAPDGYA